jgi:hypothetical protein
MRYILTLVAPKDMDMLGTEYGLPSIWPACIKIRDLFHTMGMMGVECIPEVISAIGTI